MQDFRRMHVWREAHRFTLAAYRATAAFPASEQYGLASQLRRSAASIGANIAEGCGRSSAADTRRCLHVALSEACESLNHVLLSRDLGLLDEQGYVLLESRLTPVIRMLIRLIERLG